MKKKVLILLSLLVTIIVFGMYFCDRVITLFAVGKSYSTVGDMPFNRVGLLLGTSKIIENGRGNLFYSYRIDAATQLIRANKIKYLVISGDNGRSDYNEPESMRQDLIRRGIDSSIIYLDYAGFRTFDSIKRLKEIFGQDSVTFISQKFHNERAIYLAHREGIIAVGFNANNVNSRIGFRTELREKFARVKVFLDLWFGTKPKYLGHKVIIPS